MSELEVQLETEIEDVEDVEEEEDLPEVTNEDADKIVDLPKLPYRIVVKSGPNDSDVDASAIPKDEWVQIGDVAEAQGWTRVWTTQGATSLSGVPKTLQTKVSLKPTLYKK